MEIGSTWKKRGDAAKRANKLQTFHLDWLPLGPWILVTRAGDATAEGNAHCKAVQRSHFEGFRGCHHGWADVLRRSVIIANRGENWTPSICVCRDDMFERLAVQIVYVILISEDVILSEVVLRFAGPITLKHGEGSDRVCFMAIINLGASPVGSQLGPHTNFIQSRWQWSRQMVQNYWEISSL